MGRGSSPKWPEANQREPAQDNVLLIAEQRKQSFGIEDFAAAAEGIETLPRELVLDEAVSRSLVGLPLIERVKAIVAEAALVDQDDLVRGLAFIREHVFEGREKPDDLALRAKLFA
jgi:hypothetical protein